MCIKSYLIQNYGVYMLKALKQDNFEIGLSLDKNTHSCMKSDSIIIYTVILISDLLLSYIYTHLLAHFYNCDAKNLLLSQNRVLFSHV